MTFTINLIVIPILVTLGALVMALRPYHQQGDYDFGIIFRVLWLVPIALVWLLYAVVALWRCGAACLL